MTVGQPLTATGVSVELSQLAIQLRDLCALISEKHEEYNNAGQAGLVAAGFSSADAASVLTDINYMATISGCYYGTVQQGGSGGTGAILFNFDSALSGLWGDQ